MAWRTDQHATRCPRCGGLLVVEVEAFYNIQTQVYEHPWVYVEPCDDCEWEPRTRKEFREVLRQIPEQDLTFGVEDFEDIVEKAYVRRWEPHRLRVVIPFACGGCCNVSE
ncbi:MAG: hypothetical protein DRP08_06525 [Candidatus Aenigmatarchaeota archaeon]|nr:MAG: hypothetical protein DRP08_06525 [Candidatus Aenigmarchaeota archaeon]